MKSVSRGKSNRSKTISLCKEHYEEAEKKWVLNQSSSSCELYTKYDISTEFLNRVLPTGKEGSSRISNYHSK